MPCLRSRPSSILTKSPYCPFELYEEEIRKTKVHATCVQRQLSSSSAFNIFFVAVKAIATQVHESIDSNMQRHRSVGNEIAFAKANYWWTNILVFAVVLAEIIAA